MKYLCSLSIGFTAFAGLSSAAAAIGNKVPVKSMQCGDNNYEYNSLAGYGFVTSQARDKFGDTLGGIGSSVSFQPGSWKKNGSKYTGILYTLPDRGWNTQGTLNFQSRVHKFKIIFDPTSVSSSKPNLEFVYLDTILFTGPDGTATTGLDADASGALTYARFPDLPVATYEGDGFGGSGQGGKRITIDCEGLVANKDGSFFVSDEYGPYIYKFNSKGKMLQAIRPPDAFIPIRNGTESFNSLTPPHYDQNRTTTPQDPTSGRGNNQGFEGLTISPDGKTLSALIQSALTQEGGLNKAHRDNARLVQYDITEKKAKYKAEFVIKLPSFTDAKGKTKIAAQSEIHAISDKQFFVLARDSGAGYGSDSSESLYRSADIFDISKATDVKDPKNDGTNSSIATTDGALNIGINTAEYCQLVNFNNNTELSKFGLHNGGAQDLGLLNEKWESLALVPVDGKKGKDGKFFLFSLSDNDFVTTKGYMNGGKFPYSDKVDVNNQALVFRVTLPVKKGSYAY